jgi:hypothetical protein
MTLFYSIILTYQALIFLEYYSEFESLILSTVLTTIYAIIFNNLELMNGKQLKYNNDLVKKFNKAFKIGDKVVFREHTHSKGKECTVNSKAFMDHGYASVLLKEKKCICGIDPLFLKYPE